MCPMGGFCSLCLCSSSELKELVDENGQYNNIFEIAARYFEPMLLTEAICENCWQHIYEFYEFQQSVLKAQTNLENVKNNESIVKLEIMLIDNEEVNKEDPKEDLNVSAPYKIDLQQPTEDEIPLMLTAEEEVNDEYLKEIPNASISNSFDFKDTNPFESEDEIPLGEYSIRKIQELENFRLTETQKHIKNVKKLNKLPAIDDSKKVTKISEEFKFACMFCDQKFKRASMLRRHTTTHTHARGTYKCPHCKKIFLSKKNIRRHVKSFHPNEMSSFNAKNIKCIQKDVNFNANATQMNAKVYSPDKEFNMAKKNQVNVTSDTAKPPIEDQLNLVCSLCNNKKFKHPYLYRYHMACKHRESKTIQCPYCPSKTSWEVYLRTHIKRAHPEKCVEPEVPKWKWNEPKVDLNLIGRDLQSTEDHSPNYDDYDAFIAKWKPDLECPLCQSTSTSWDLLGVHFKEQHPDKDRYVNCCKQKMYCIKRLVEHLRFHLDPNSFKCEICGRCVNNGIALRRHMRIHNETKSFQCEVCLKSFLRRSKLLAHVGIHSTERNVMCKVCNRGFATKLILNKHVYNTHKKNKYLCDQCGHHCITANALKEHILEHSVADKPKWYCDRCDMQFSSRITLGSHINMIHINAIYVCTGCGENLNSKPNFDLHNKSVHDGKSRFKYKCIECDKQIESAHAFRQHVDVHTGEAHYQCPHCPIILKHKKNIARHIKMLHPLEVTKKSRKNKTE